MRRSAPWVVIAVYAALGLAWAMTNAPFSAPDESQHYLRAVGISSGHIVGAPAVYNGPVLSPKETAWRHRLTRAVTVPPGLSPVGYECELFHPAVTPACSDHVRPNATSTVEQTDVGIYQPAPYLVPALVIRAAHHPAGADRIGRLGMVVLWVTLLSIATWALWDTLLGMLSLIGLVVAVTPMVIFMGSSLTDSSLEIIAALAFFCSLLRATRPGQSSNARWLIVAGITGGVTALSRSLGPLWVVWDVVLCLVLRAGAVHVLPRRRPSRAALLAGVLVVAGIVLNFVWVRIYGPHVSPTLLPRFSSLHDGFSQLRAAWDGVIGVFGYEDVPLGRFGVVVWTLVGLSVIAGAAVVGRVRDRIALAVSIAGAVALPIYIYAAITSAEGIQTQGRHILPLLVTVPLLAGEILRRNADGLPELARRLLIPVAFSTAAVIQLLAWWENSRRYAVGLHGSWWFLANPHWSPPVGWAMWTVVVGVAVGALVVSGLMPGGGSRSRLRAT